MQPPGRVFEADGQERDRGAPRAPRTRASSSITIKVQPRGPTARCMDGSVAAPTLEDEELLTVEETAADEAILFVPASPPADTAAAIEDGGAAPSASPRSAETASADGEVRAPAAPEHHSLVEVVTQYGQYVALFVGAGLISGSVVHFPLAPTRYAIIGGIGAAIFAVASVLSDRAGKDVMALARIAVSSLALALGIGMISGSIQHFQDIPERAARLIPIGLTLSVGAFIVRNALRPKKDDLAAIALWAVTAVAVLAIGLGQVADRMTAEPARGTESTSHHGAEATESSKAEGEATANENADAAESSDGHGH